MEQTNQLPLKIMLIEDTDVDMYLNERFIKKWGGNITILKFTLGTHAIDYFMANNNDIENIPNIILLDIRMPLMDGFEFVDQFEKFPEEVKSKCTINLLSSSIDPNDQKKVIESSLINKIYQKPLTKETLNEILGRPV